MDCVQGNRIPDFTFSAEACLREEKMMEIDLSRTFDFVIGFIFLAIFIVVSVAVVVEGYLESKEKDTRRKLEKKRSGKCRRKETARDTTA